MTDEKRVAVIQQIQRGMNSAEAAIRALGREDPADAEDKLTHASSALETALMRVSEELYA